VNNRVFARLYLRGVAGRILIKCEAIVAQNFRSRACRLHGLQSLAVTGWQCIQLCSHWRWPLINEVRKSTVYTSIALCVWNSCTGWVTQ